MGAFTDTFAPLQNRNLRIYFSGQAISLIGTWMQVTAQSWVVWRLTQSEAALGTVGMLATVPFLLLGPIAGVWADRYDRRKILVYTQSVAMVLAFILAFLVQTNLVQIWHVYVLALALGCVNALDMPSQQAFIGDMTGMDMVRKAVVVNAMIVQISRVFGPTLAGLVVKAVGEATAFWINGLSFLAVIASLLAVRTMTQARRVGGPTGGSFAEGVRFVFGQPRIFDLMVFTGLVTLFGFSNSQVLPAFADETLHGDAGLYGLLMGASGVGALISVLFLVPPAQRMKRTGQMLSAAVAFAGAAFTLFSFTKVPALALPAFFLSGISIPMVLSTNNGLVQVLAPHHMRARLLTLYLMFSFGLQPIANLWVGWMAHALGAPMAIRINGLSMLVIALLMLLRPGLRTWEPSAAVAAKPQGGA
ncbi:MAG TPA: MFS transporter [Symbiobacteriaceae bacterium]|nr:MFS transporter [Symbiobacteriaceae bacterium]